LFSTALLRKWRERAREEKWFEGSGGGKARTDMINITHPFKTELSLRQLLIVPISTLPIPYQPLRKRGSFNRCMRSLMAGVVLMVEKRSHPLTWLCFYNAPAIATKTIGLKETGERLNYTGD